MPDFNAMMNDRTFTAAEVSRFALVNIETLRVWRRRGYFGMKPSEGWTRYTWTDLFTITLFAEVINSTGSHDHARDVCTVGGPEMFKMLLPGSGDEASYIIAARHPDAPAILTVVLGKKELDDTLTKLIFGKAHYGQYSVVDLSRVTHRLLSRLTEENPSKETVALVRNVLKKPRTIKGEA